MSKDKYYKELLKQLETVQSNAEIMKILDSDLPNTIESTDYDNWVEGSLQFLNGNRNLFVKKSLVNI